MKILAMKLLIVLIKWIMVLIIEILRRLKSSYFKKKNKASGKESDDYNKLKTRIIEHEGIEESAYQDSKDYWTIGIGRMIDERRGGKLSHEEMIYLLNNDIANAEKDLSPFAWYTIQNEVRRGVLIELVISMGIGRLRGFVNMIAALTEMDYKKAGEELIDSKWAREDVSHARSSDVRHRLENGVYQ